jgi:ankyrin repeat protein
VDLERYRKDAKALVRAHRAGDPGALARAEAVLGSRGRFQLSDAQHVVAVEHGYRTWPELRRAAETAKRERPVSRIGLQPDSFYERRAEELAAALAAGDGDAERRAAGYVPRGMVDAKVVIAREYGFETWRELIATVDRVRSAHEGQREGSPRVVAAIDAIDAGDVGRLGRMLDADPGLAGEVHRGAWTTLLEAMAQPDVFDHVDPDVVRLLVERGSPVDPALNLAACFNRAELVRLLLDAGADPAPSADEGLTPLETALYHGAREAAELLAARAISPYALWSVAALGRVDMLPAFFDPNGRLRPEAWTHRPNLADVGWEPGAPPRDDPQDVLDEALGHAAHNGRDNAVVWLLDHGADVDGRPYLDMTPLHFAVQLGHASTVRLLLEKGADPSIRERLHGGTPAGWARHLDLPHLAALIEPLDSGLEYAPGDPVRLHVTVRRFPYISDEGGAVERAGRSEGWRAVADRVAVERVVNVSRSGAVSLPVVAKGPGFDAIARRVAEASLELYEELLELGSA